MTAPTTAGGAVLPVVGWRPGVKCVPEQNFNAGAPKPADIDYWQAIGCVIEYACDRNAAQAEIDALRAENERLRRESRGWEDSAKHNLSRRLSALTERNAARAELASLKDAQDDQARDAARYRWLRARLPGSAYRIAGVIYSEGGAGVDAAIDAAIDSAKETP